MPLVVFMVGCGFGTEKFTMGSAGNMVIVGVGIAIASYGEGQREGGCGRDKGGRRDCDQREGGGEWPGQRWASGSR